MHRIGINRLSKVGPNRAGCCLGGIGGAHQFTVEQNSILAFEHLNHNGARSHKLDQVAVEAFTLMLSIKATSGLISQLHHFRCHDFEPRLFKAGIDLANHVLGYSIRLDYGKGSFDRHGYSNRFGGRKRSRIIRGIFAILHDFGAVISAKKAQYFRRLAQSL